MLDGLKRFDIVCFERSGEQLPRAIVEIKHPYHGVIGNLEKDISRIAIALKTAAKSRQNPNTGRASIRHGFLAFDTWFRSPKRKDSDGDEKIRRWMNAIIDLAVGKYGVDAVGHMKKIESFQGPNKDQHVYAVVISMKAKPKSRQVE